MTKKIKSEGKVNIEHISEKYIANTDFGLKFENGESGLIQEGEVLTVLEATPTRIKLERIGWVKARSVIFRYLDPCTPHQYTFDEILSKEEYFNEY